MAIERAIDWTGVVIDRLRVLGRRGSVRYFYSYAERPKCVSTSPVWLCQCACGAHVQRSSSALRMSRRRGIASCHDCRRQAGGRKKKQT